MKPKKKEKQQPVYGWICPKCGSVYAVWVGSCAFCGPTFVTSDTTKIIIHDVTHNPTSFSLTL